MRRRSDQHQKSSQLHACIWPYVVRIHCIPIRLSARINCIQFESASCLCQCPSAGPGSVKNEAVLPVTLLRDVRRQERCIAGVQFVDLFSKAAFEFSFNIFALPRFFFEKSTITHFRPKNSVPICKERNLNLHRNLITRGKTLVFRTPTVDLPTMLCALATS